VPPHTPLTIRRTQRVGTSLYLPPDKSSFTTMMATKRRSHIFARSRVTELRSPTGIRDGSFFDARRHQASRLAEKGIIHSSGGARCTASRSASYQTGDKRGAVEKGPIRVAEFPGSKFRKTFRVGSSQTAWANGSCLASLPLPSIFLQGL